MSTEAAEPLAAFRVTTASRIGRKAPHLTVALIFAVLGFGLLTMGLSRPETNTLTPGFLCLCGGLGAAAYFVTIPAPGVWAIELDAAGFDWEDSSGRHRAAWEEVVASRRTPKLIVNGFVRSGSTALTLTGGRQVLLDYALEDYDRLADLVQRLRAELVAPRLMEELAAGKPVGFGPVSVDPAGIEHNGYHRPWHSFAYAFDSGSLVLVPAAGAFGWHDRVTVGMADLPDALALARVLAAFQPPADPFWTIPSRDRESLARG